MITLACREVWSANPVATVGGSPVMHHHFRWLGSNAGDRDCDKTVGSIWTWRR
jgi:hypothetical protein